MVEKQYVIDDLNIQESWRIFRIISEFVDGFEALTDVYPAVSVFGSSRSTEDDPVYAVGVRLGRLLAEAGFAVITGGGPGAMAAAVPQILDRIRSSPPDCQAGRSQLCFRHRGHG